MEHKHITSTHPDWAVHNYQCVCGFKTGDRTAFDNHLKEKTNQSLDSDRESSDVLE